MANKYRLFEDSTLVGEFTVPEIARILGVTEDTVYNAQAKQRKIKKHFKVEPIQKEKVVQGEWATKTMEEWEEVRLRINPKAKPRYMKAEPAAVPEESKPEEKPRAIRRSDRYTSAAVRFR